MTDDTTAKADRPLNVLVLEDEAIILLDIEYALRDAGMEPRNAMNVKQALDLIAEQTPDAAVLDVNLGKDETCEEVAAALVRLGVPFVIHSGDLSRHGEVITRFDAPVLSKPKSADEIAAAVRALPPSSARS